MKLGFDFEMKEPVRRSENYINPEHNPYPIPENEPHAQNPIPENEPHAQNPISKNEPHVQFRFTQIASDPEEKIDADWTAIYSLLKVAHICEDMARKCRNADDVDLEELYLNEAHHAQEAANILYILNHK